MKETKKTTPNWLLFLFFGSLIGGALYTTFLHGFLGYDIHHSYRMANGSLYVKPELSIVPERSDQGIQSGEQNFARVCVACHGSYGQYKPGLLGPDLADGKWLHDDREQQIARLIQNGVGAAESITKQVMPARAGVDLSDRVIWEVVYYLSSKNPSIVKDAEPTE